jgi:hypothetical protein
MALRIQYALRHLRSKGGSQEKDKQLSVVKSRSGKRNLGALISKKTAGRNFQELEVATHERSFVLCTNYDELISRALEIKPPVEGWSAYEGKLKSQRKSAYASKQLQTELSPRSKIKKTHTLSPTKSNELEISWLREGLSRPSKNIKELARLLKVHHTIVYKMLWGTRRIKMDELCTIAAYIGQPGSIDIFSHSTNGFDVTVKVITRAKNAKP